jgi:predicted DNA-binding transcriptional regulator AlpA
MRRNTSRLTGTCGHDEELFDGSIGRREMSRAAYSVREWCERRGIGRATFYARLPHGEMPAIVKIGRRMIITLEADEEWRERMEEAAARKNVGGGR